MAEHIRYFFEDTGEEYAGHILESSGRLWSTTGGTMEGNSRTLEQRNDYRKNGIVRNSDTTFNSNHIHKYLVDEEGNGWTEWAIHPDNENVKHRHQIINFEVQIEASECYPNCESMYGVNGAPPHSHLLRGQVTVKNLRREVTRSEEIKKLSPKTPGPVIRQTTDRGDIGGGRGGY
tara:strand:- start:648 stop:1175 length:528 start_codon:yes stop_codon:yes gene_type:complete